MIMTKRLERLGDIKIDDEKMALDWKLVKKKESGFRSTTLDMGALLWLWQPDQEQIHIEADWEEKDKGRNEKDEEKRRGSEG